MATNFAHLDIEIAHFENIVKYLPSYNKLCKATIRSLLEMGCLTVSTIYEQALANVGGYKVVSEDTHDFDTGDDAKLCTVRTRSSYNVNVAQITGVKNKIGNLLVQIYERKQEQFYYLAIPNHSFKDLKTVEIRFDLDGNPKRYNKWWNFEVSSFEELAQGYKGKS